MECSALILAGGESRRMGRDKAWLELDGRPLIERAVERLRRLGIREILISGRAGEDYSALNCPVLLDRAPGLGPLGGIERGLRECTTHMLLVLAVDLPRMSPAFLIKMQQASDHLIGVVPELNGRLEPLAAIYPQRCHTLALAALARAQLSVRDFATACLRDQAVRIYPVTERDAPEFLNWNRPDDFVPDRDRTSA